MKTLIIILCFILTAAVKAQSVYEVTPGTKGNRVILSLANISEIQDARDVSVKLSRPSANISFGKNEEVIKIINPGKETEAAFLFDIKRNAPVNKKDTVEFLVTGSNGILVKKEFVFSFSPPKEYKLEQNYPNPFNPATTIMYQLPFEGKVTLKVYDILGGEVATLVNEAQSPGYKETKFNGSRYSTGVYVYRLTAESPNGSYTSIKKMILIK